MKNELTALTICGCISWFLLTSKRVASAMLKTEMHSARCSEGKHKGQVVVKFGEHIATVFSLFHRVYRLER